MGTETTVLVAAMAVAVACCLSIVSATLASLKSSAASLPAPRTQQQQQQAVATPVVATKAPKFAFKTATSGPSSGTVTLPTGKTVDTTTTYHTDFSTNACNSMPQDPKGYNTAMSADLAFKLGVPKPGPGSPTCGRMLSVTDKGTKKTIKVKVLDLRGNERGLDVHQPAFVELAGSAGVAAGVANVTVGFV